MDDETFTMTAEVSITRAIMSVVCLTKICYYSVGRGVNVMSTVVMFENAPGCHINPPGVVIIKHCCTAFSAKGGCVRKHNYGTRERGELL